jgi:hypothetical protein
MEAEAQEAQELALLGLAFRELTGLAAAGEVERF